MDRCYPPVRRFFFTFLLPSKQTLYCSLFLFITTVYLLSTSTLSPDGAVPPLISSWATFLGVSSALLATVQYAPQLLHTYRKKLVGALSIPMMSIQTPGGVLMVTSIALRKGTNWTSGFLFFSPFIEGKAWWFPYRLDHICRSRRFTRLSSRHVLYMEDPTKQTRHRWFWESCGSSRISYRQHRRSKPPPRSYSYNGRPC